MAAVAGQDDAWLPIPDLSNDEWRDFQKLFGADGQSGDDLLAELDSMTAPEAMDLDADFHEEWSLPALGPFDASNDAVSLHAQNIVECPALINQDTREKQQSPKESKKDKPAKKRQPRIPPEARATLEGYYALNPYPSADQFRILADQTKLEVKKIRTWFSNARSRHPEPYTVTQRLNNSTRSGYGRQRIAPRQPTGQTTTSEHVHERDHRRSTNRLSKDSLDRLSIEFPPDQLQPLDAWMSSSTEPVGTAAIEAALVGRQSDAYSSDLPSQSPAPSLFSRAASSAGSAATRATKYSMSSRGSNVSAFSMRSRRKGRKRIAKVKNETYLKQGNLKQAIEVYKAATANLTERTKTLEHPEDGKEKKFFCTFCGDRFKNSYEWKRHEESIHFPRSTWVCCPSKGALFVNCPFCPHANPDELHLAQHGYFTCNALPEEDRTFYRKDQFKQHLRTAHLGPNCKQPKRTAGSSESVEHGCDFLLNAWLRPAATLAKDDPALHCGFCGEWLTTWEERCRHVSNHFSPWNKDLCSWWPQRLPNVLYDTWDHLHLGPLRCRYCSKVFEAGDWSHKSCEVWSCRFLRDVNALTQDVNWSKSIAVGCFLSMADETNSRNCGQELYSSYDHFVNHLQVFHGANEHFEHPEVYAQIIKNYYRNKKAVFEPASDSDLPAAKNFHTNGPAPSQSMFSFQEDAHALPSPLLTPVYSYNNSAHPHSWSQPQQLRMSTNPIIPPLPLAHRPFIDITPSFPRPMSVAAALDPPSVHLSTVSRLSRSSFQPVAEPIDNPPRFCVGFRTFLSEFPTLFYLKAGSTTAPSQPTNILGRTEIDKGFLASLVMSSGLMGMATQGVGPRMQGDESGWLGFGVDE